MPQSPKYDLPPLDLGDETIGQRIARLRKEKGLTQTELAEIIGINRNLVAAYEQGRVRLYDEMVIRFAFALKLTTDKLLGVATQENLEPPPSIRVMRRLRDIEKLPEVRKKIILRTIDDLIRANQ